MIAALTLLVFAVMRIIENLGAQSLKKVVENWFK